MTVGSSFSSEESEDREDADDAICLVLFEALGFGTGLVSRIEASFFVLLLPRVFVAFKVTGEDFLAAVPFFFFFPGV